jgi:putative phage-type endonuclease
MPSAAELQKEINDLKRMIGKLDFLQAIAAEAQIAQMERDVIALRLTEGAFPECVRVGAPEHDSPEWHMLRRAGIGSSDAAAVLGIDPFQDSRDLYFDKIGVPQEESKPYLAPYAWFGNWFEEHVIAEIGRVFRAEGAWGPERRLLRGSQIGCLRSVKIPFAQANLDSYDPVDQVIHEIKTVQPNDESRNDKLIPERYFAQAQHQMMVTGAKKVRLHRFCARVYRDTLPALRERLIATVGERHEEGIDRSIAGWILDFGEVTTWTVDRDDIYIEHLRIREEEFWKMVQDMSGPPIAKDRIGEVDLTSVTPVKEAVQKWVEGKDLDGILRVTQEEELRRRRVAQNIIERWTAVAGQRPKRVKVGPHSVTWIDKRVGSHWRLYPADMSVKDVADS